MAIAGLATCAIGFQENRRILELLRGIETKALALRDLMPLDELALRILI